MRKSVIRSTKGKAEAILERDCRSTASMPERAVRPGGALFVKDNAAPPSSCAFSCFETPTAIVCAGRLHEASDDGFPNLRKDLSFAILSFAHLSGSLIGSALVTPIAIPVIAVTPQPDPAADTTALVVAPPAPPPAPRSTT